MQEKIKYSSEISVFKQEWLCETFCICPYYSTFDCQKDYEN